MWKKLSSDKDWVKATFQVGKRFDKAAQGSSKKADVDETNPEEIEPDFDDDDNIESQETDKNPTFKLIPFSETNEDSWVLVNYEDEYFLGKIVEKLDAEKKCKVTLLHENFAVF